MHLIIRTHAPSRFMFPLRLPDIPRLPVNFPSLHGSSLIIPVTQNSYYPTIKRTAMQIIHKKFPFIPHFSYFCPCAQACRNAMPDMAADTGNRTPTPHRRRHGDKTCAGNKKTSTPNNIKAMRKLRSAGLMLMLTAIIAVSACNNNEKKMTADSGILPNGITMMPMDSLDFTYQLGGKVYDSEYATSMAGSRGYAFHTDLINAWTPENVNSNIPKYEISDTNMAAASDRFLTSASYLCLQNVNFGYTLPKNLVAKAHLTNVRVYFSGSNLWLWSKRQGLDPRQSITGATAAYTYSPMRTIQGGVTISF